MFLPSLVCLTWSSDWYSSSLRPGPTWFHNSLHLAEGPQPSRVIYYAPGHGKPAVPQILVKVGSGGGDVPKYHGSPSSPVVKTG